jgi:L-malate glycosyltransferase
VSRLRYALIGDAESPHLLKWARALAPRTELWVASSRGFRPEFDGLLRADRRLALHGPADAAGGNVGLLKQLPALGRWLRQVDADWLNPHYLTSHGMMAALARRGWAGAGWRPLRGALLGSAWGSDILVTPERHWAYRLATQQVLRACRLCTSDSTHMAGRMRELGAREVMVFPFGLEALPPAPPPKQPWRFFTNRGLEPIYRPERVLRLFAQVAALKPEARLVVANEGSLRPALERLAESPALAGRVSFVGRLGAEAQAAEYAQAQWFLSQPASDAVSVSVLEAMAHGCIPLLSSLPANAELVQHGQGGLLLADADGLEARVLEPLLERAGEIARAHRAWVAEHGLFGPSVERLLARLQESAPAR